jgi:hypothetical protein
MAADYTPSGLLDETNRRPLRSAALRLLRRSCAYRHIRPVEASRGDSLIAGAAMILV